jgi:hypothetical protein
MLSSRAPGFIRPAKKKRGEHVQRLVFGQGPDA